MIDIFRKGRAISIAIEGSLITTNLYLNPQSETYKSIVKVTRPTNAKNVEQLMKEIAQTLRTVSEADEQQRTEE